MTRHTGPAHRVMRDFMWVAMFASGVLVIVAHLAGWGWHPLTTVAAVLFVLCAATCLWTVAVGRQSEEAVDAAVEQLKALREQQRRTP